MPRPTRLPALGSISPSQICFSSFGLRICNHLSGGLRLSYRLAWIQLTPYRWLQAASSPAQLGKGYGKNTILRFPCRPLPSLIPLSPVLSVQGQMYMLHGVGALGGPGGLSPQPAIMRAFHSPARRPEGGWRHAATVIVFYSFATICILGSFP